MTPINLNTASVEEVEVLDKPVTLEELEDEDPGTAPQGVDPETWESWKAWKERQPNDFMYQVMRGMEGKNVGLDNGLTNINKYLYGTHMARYYLIGADSNVGKTTVADFMYVLKAWESAKAMGRKIKIFYCSFEIGKMDKEARWVCYYIFLKYGIRFPADYVLGRIKGKLITKAHLKLIIEGYAKVNEIMQDIIFVDTVFHPTAIFEDLIQVHYEKHGKVHRTEITADERKAGKRGFVKGFTANDPDLITMLVIDHLALTGSEQKLDTKGIMDRMSKYAVVLRNIFHTTVVFIQQFSTELMSWHRTQKKSVEAIAPQRLDFGDSKATYRDADVVIGLTKPITFDYEEFKGYQIIPKDGRDGFGHCFIAMYLMKNRYGPSGRLLPIFIDGCSGCIYDLPLEVNNPLALEPWLDRARLIARLPDEFKPAA